MSQLIKLNEMDNVAIVRRHLNVGEEGAVMAIPKGHKMALCEIAQGQPVIKYSQIIGPFLMERTFMLKILNFEGSKKNTSMVLRPQVSLKNMTKLHFLDLSDQMVKLGQEIP